MLTLVFVLVHDDLTVLSSHPLSVAMGEPVDNRVSIDDARWAGWVSTGQRRAATSR